MNNENWILCRKPLTEKTVADNVLKYGVGGINIDGSRIEIDNSKEGSNTNRAGKTYNNCKSSFAEGGDIVYYNEQGRFPANFIYCGDDDVLNEFSKAGYSKKTTFRGSTPRKKGGTGNSWSLSGEKNAPSSFGDEGTPSRFFFNTKELDKDE